MCSGRLSNAKVPLFEAKRSVLANGRGRTPAVRYPHHHVGHAGDGYANMSGRAPTGTVVAFGRAVGRATCLGAGGTSPAATSSRESFSQVLVNVWRAKVIGWPALGLAPG
jgi:hypothetical protein